MITNENKWVWDLHQKLQVLMEGAVEPLYEYLTVYEPYKEILRINPDDYVRQLELKE